MSFIKQFSHSFLAKLIALIISIALSILLFLFFTFNYINANDLRHHFFALSVIIATIFAIAIYFVHRLLIPVRKLSYGVKEISNGNLDVRIDIKNADELGRLALAFNQMAKDLKSMIEAKEQLLLDVSHELRTPLTRSRLALEMVEESEYVLTVKRNLREMETMIKELLESHRLRSSFSDLNISKIDLLDFLNELILEYENELPGVKIEPFNPHIVLIADIELMKIVCRNVIENALKYSPESAPPVKLSVSTTHEHLMIEISDSGPGLRPEDMAKVFEPFYRTDKSRSRNTGGYGLGLHLCKKIISAHNGEITIFNKEHETGLVVRLLFPVNT